MKSPILIPILGVLGLGFSLVRPSRVTGQSAVPSKATELRLPRIFGDGMVLQRDKPVTVWGVAPARTGIAVTFRGHTLRATTNARGEWMVNLPAERAGGPFELVVRSDARTLEVRDVFVGDVWVASGQSNMEFKLAQAKNGAAEVAAANDNRLRQFKVPTSWSYSPEQDLAGGSWTVADPSHAADFSAVAYFFAREIRKSIDVPIGIINTTWGGSNIETWLSRRALGLNDSAWSAIVRAEESYAGAVRDSLRAKFGQLPTKDEGLIDGTGVWADPSLDDHTWTDIQVPAYWEDHGFTGMDGVAWYRMTFDLDDRDVQRGVSLSIAAIDDDDITWVNGVEVGRTVGYNVSRSYQLSRNTLRVGKNLLAVRVADGGGGGGINGAVSLSFGDGSQRSLAGRWKFKVGELSFKPDGQHINKIPAILYNKMVHPLLPFAIKGVIWYQGESNANNMAQAAAYRGQFASLITSWRHELESGRETFPFLWVQLPNFGQVETAPPAQAAWATQRESMEAALSLPNTGRAVTIDVGGDLHPPNKQDVGARLARVALGTVYGRSVVASGPTYRSYHLVGDTAVVEFANAAGGLVTSSNEGRVGAFALAGVDRKFVWANAKIVGDRVYVWSDDVKKPVAVRYAWANNPANANLYNRERLPAAPFRTDRW